MTGFKDIHLEDVAFQRYCCEKSGLTLRRCALMFLKKDHVRHGETDPARLFIQEDVTDQVDVLVPAVRGKIRQMLKVIAGPRPGLEIGSGDAASRAGLLLSRSDLPPEERVCLHQSLLTYCRQDTTAMVGILEKLRFFCQP